MAEPVNMFSAGFDTPGGEHDEAPTALFDTYAKAKAWLATLATDAWNRTREWENDHGTADPDELDANWEALLAELRDETCGGPAYTTTGGGFVWWVMLVQVDPVWTELLAEHLRSMPTPTEPPPF